MHSGDDRFLKTVTKKVLDKWEKLPLAAKASAAYAICSIIQKCISFITMPLFTRIMTTEQYGEMTVYSSWSGIFSIVLTLNLAYGSFSPAMIKYEKNRYSYISSIQGIFLALSALFIVIYVPFTDYWNSLFGLSTPLVFLLVLETISVNSIHLWSGKKRFDYEYKPIITVTLLMSIISTVVSLIAVINSDNKGFVRIVAHSVVVSLIGIGVFVYNYIKGKSLFNREYWKYALGFNIPLLAYYLSQTIFNQSDRIMIDHYCGKGKAAIYGVAYTLAMILTFVLNAINNSYVPWFYQKIKEGKEKENAKISLGIAALMAVLVLAVVIMAPEVIMIMAGEKYHDAIWIIPPVAISLILLFYSQLFINVQFYYEKKSELVYASIGAAVANIILNAILIPKVSYIAAGYTTMVSYIIFAVANYFTMKRVAKKENFSLDAINIKLLLSLFGVFCLSCFSVMLLYPYIIIRYLLVFIGCVLCIVFRKRIISFIKSTVMLKK